MIGLGVIELSMNKKRIPIIKERVRSLDMNTCKRLAKEALSKSTAKEVRELWKTI